MTNRATLQDRFVAASGWADARRTTVAGDASNRRYDRLTHADGTSVILMDAPPDKGEDVRPFIRIAEHLSACGLSAPGIIARDTAQGFLLIEDLGDDLYKTVIARDPAMERSLYEAAVDVLTHLHAVPAPSLPTYDSAVMTDLAALTYAWYVPGAGAGDPHAAEEFRSLFSRAMAVCDAEPAVLVQRDYHAENLLWLPERDGPARVGLLDFQDAMAGHPAYDLVSILQDARRDVLAEIEAAMIDRFVAQSGADRDTFNAAYALLGAQRNLRILGVFARLCIRDGKAHYVDLIPRVWGHVQTNLAHPALHEVAQLVTRTVPAPTPEILERLKSKCATAPSPS
ncbi:aminoglycoside phosphotransferase family protein [Sulfitobacter sp. S190]|uniref:aminoglycoside phosphotransferase family protein n=1 Tax=Sulfitobacter sp. S190 TaxID=2867022 RepID=UPI0021A5F023|nr:phosphotransferase [Sulfitobacter sp. S190]UWR22452.1 phosphotransferase [Sulfitobacter sp. S190]